MYFDNILYDVNTILYFLRSKLYDVLIFIAFVILFDD